ncbi:hypothetical protein EIP91_006675 [Steccherinum ochraceum]|uniref:Uncharacterized protein n=1 Tax=Steccherinum ochraceum TaxID=92696 RepID=A0A4R0RZ18_9APHY|nr:hypothetical protein EIP91_006675 [Steccherinum ochraceum]
MHSLFTIAAVAFSATLGVSGQAANPKASTIAALRTAPTANDRLNILKSDSDFVFDFNNNTATKGGAGQTVGANVANFPALTNQGLAMTVGWLGENTPFLAPLCNTF